MRKQKIEFSKKWLIGCIIVSIVYTTLSYILAFCGKDTVENLSIEIIQTLWGTSAISFVFYCGQNGIRAFTGSKWGIPKEEVEEAEETYENKRGD